LLYVRKAEKRSRIVFLTPEEARLLSACEEHFPSWYPFILALHRLSPRIGEACALQWGDFDLEARCVDVRRNFYVWSDTPDKYADARIIFKDLESSNWTWDPQAKAHYWHRFTHTSRTLCGPARGVVGLREG
jgi:integrase